MVEYIERDVAMLMPILPKEYRQYQTENLDDAYEQGWLDAIGNLKNVPAADVVSVEILKKWLYENALNNAGNSYGVACVEITRRLNGLRRYAKAVENGNIQSSC